MEPCPVCGKNSLRVVARSGRYVEVKWCSTCGTLAGNDHGGLPSEGFLPSLLETLSCGGSFPLQIRQAIDQRNKAIYESTP